MALEGKYESKKLGEKDGDVFTAEFTNGTVEQLKEIAAYLDAEGFDLPKDDQAARLKEVVQIGIAWLERLKAQQDKDKPVATD